jgi:hypothetical protein
VFYRRASPALLENVQVAGYGGEFNGAESPRDELHVGTTHWRDCV